MKYVNDLIGRDTVNTIPLATLEAFKDHGTAALTLEGGEPDPTELLNQIELLGISLEMVTRELEQEGVQAFATAFDQLIGTIEQRVDTSH